MIDMNLSFPVARFLPYMPDVGKCERSLHELNLMWRMIEASAKMNCPTEAKTILPTVMATRVGFGQLEEELVASLAREKMNTVQAEMATKAQYIIEIVVRNLYERTADVGFLATDGQLCDFVAGIAGDAAAIGARLRSYRGKYSVYDEIMLLAPDGRVLAQIDDASPVARSADPLIAATLASDSYVETFRASDLRPGGREALIYSRRMHHPSTGAVTGVLCLCFRFEEEMARIFQTHRDHTERAVMLLLGADDRVIASADPLWIPLGVKVPVNRAGAPTLMKHAGREYLARTFGSPGYQGYQGPHGWQGQVMIPVDLAFGGVDSAVLAGLAPEWADGLLSHAQAFCPPLFEIIGAADMIRRVVWNGQVMSAGQEGDMARLESVLEQISETGARSNALFSRSIGELFETVLASGLRDAEFMSHLMVDLLDRNLYERANDCRWWALSPELAALLAGDAPDRGARMERVLAYINGLYTVYSSLVVYDRDGAILAATGDPGNHGAVIDADTLARVLALRTEQDYHVTPFAPSPLYGGRPTYVYHAAIRAPGGADVIGGIGIVFDAAIEFDAMLRGALGGHAGMQAYFLDGDGAVIASTDPARPVGARLALPARLSALENGGSGSCLLTHDEHYALMGCTVSHGYREFKVSDGYPADVLAVVVESFGPVRSGIAGGAPARLVKPPVGSERGVEFATFFIGGALFAMGAGVVHEARAASRLAPVSMGGGAECVGILAPEEGDGDQDGFVWVYDLGYFISGQATAIDGKSQVVVVRHAGRTVGLLVSELHGVAKFERHDLIDLPLARQDGPAMVRQVIKANAGEVLIQVIDIAYLFALLENGKGM